MRNDLCRLCAKHVIAQNALNLFKKDSHKHLTQIKAITGLQLKPKVNVPEYMCKNCELDLQQASAFRQRCIDVQLALELPNIEVTMTSEEEIDLLKNENDSTNSLYTTGTINYENEIIDVCETVLSDDDIIANENFLSDNFHKDNHLDDIYTENEAINEEEEEKSDNQILAPIKVKRRRKNKRRVKSKLGLSDNRNRFICDQCGNHVYGRNAFEIHLRRHFGDKQFQCEICTDCFCTHSELKRHMRKHTGERPFKCKFCTRCFTDYSTRVKHERTHTNERPFSCCHCSKAFTSSYILKNHMLIHTGERSYRCDFCNKSFQRQTHLSTHFRSLLHKHNQEKAQKMQQCNLDVDN